MVNFITRMKKPDFFFRVKQIMLGFGTVLFFLSTAYALPSNASASESAFFVPEKIITGTVTDEDGEPLIGASVAIEGGTTGVITDIDGNFSIEAEEGDVLVISYLGYSDQRVTVGADNSVSVVMAGDATLLSEIVVEGIRGSEMRAVQMKREATSVIEAITPQQLGNFSDENMADALQRVPGLQVQRDNQGNGGGSRVSIRGVGPEFVNVTVNGRTLLSSGNEGFENLRVFNVDMLPPEVLSGALVYKASEARLIEPGLGGLIDFQTIRPLDVSYKEGRNYFGSVNVRGEWDEQTNEDNVLDLRPRVSGLLGAKTKDGKLGAYISALTSRSNRSNQFNIIRRGPANVRPIRIDQNENGTWDGTDGGDVQVDDVIVPNNPISVPVKFEIERLAINGGLQFRPVSNLDVNLDYSHVEYDRATDRNATNIRVRPDAIQNGVFLPGNVEIDGNNVLRYLNTADAFDRRNRALATPRIQNGFQEFDETDHNQFGGANVNYTIGKWNFNADYSLSRLEYNQEFNVTGIRFAALPSGFIFDMRGDIPQYSANSADEYNTPNLDNNRTSVNRQFSRQFRRTLADNDAFRLDVSRELNENFSVTVGYRYSKNVIDYRRVISTPGLRFGANELDKNEFFTNYVTNPSDHEGEFFDGVNLGNLLESPSIFDIGAFRRDYADKYAIVPTGAMYDADLFDVENEEFFQLDRGGSFDLEEVTNSFYTQIDFKDIELGATTKLSGNLGIRGIQTEIDARAFSNADVTSPDEPEFTPITLASAPTTSSADRWDWTPALNLGLDFNNKFAYRASIVRTMSRPDIDDLVPSNDVDAISPTSPVFGDVEGTATSSNPSLSPFTAWQTDHTFEWYNKFGGAVVASFFAKWIEDFIIDQTQTGVTFDELGFDLEGLPANVSGQTPYTVTRPVNSASSDLFGFEVGFVQPLSVISESLDGFGVRANYTYVSADFDDIAGNTGGAFPGSSKNNFTGIAYFENETFGVRVAYTYRDEFLRSVGGGNDILAAPIFTEGFGQLNVRANFNFLDNFQFSISGENLTGEDRRNYYDNDPTQVARIFTTGQIWTIGLRYGF